MSIRSGFYQSINGDRKYDADDLNMMTDGLASDGVLKGVGGEFKVESISDWTVRLYPGKIVANNVIFHIDEYEYLDFNVIPSDPILSRIDSIVITIDSSIGRRTSTVSYSVGMMSPNPVSIVAEIDRNIEQYRAENPNSYVFVVASILIQAGAESVRMCPIISNIGNFVPYAKCQVKVASDSTLIKRLKKELDAKFEEIKKKAVGTIDCTGVIDHTLPSGTLSLFLTNDLIKTDSILDIYCRCVVDGKYVTPDVKQIVCQNGSASIIFRKAFFEKIDMKIKVI